MSRSYAFRVPASTANLGAGFDALSLALERYLRVRLEVPSAEALRLLPEGETFGIEAGGVDAEKIPASADNLIVRVARSVARQKGRTLPPFRLAIENEIPLARGMGSSASAIIAGITCYELLAEDNLNDQEMFGYAYEFEPHPDNLAAALYGGLVVAATTAEGEVLVAKLSVPDGVQPIVVIPAFELSTEKARAVLPQTYSRKDAVYNVQRAALAVAALTSGNWGLVREAMRDKIHQPYRAPLIPGFEDILKLDAPGLIGVALSGAGPTVLALARPAEAPNVGRAISSLFEKAGVEAAAHILKIDTAGRTIEQSNRTH
jgi:homoserine kinase